MKLQGVESLAVVLLFSFVDPAHERRVREIAAEELPGVMVSLSHEVMPSAPEFERTSTTLVNAYVGPRSSATSSGSTTAPRGGLRRRAAHHAVERRRHARRLRGAEGGGGHGLGAGGRTMGAPRSRRRRRRDFISVDMGGTSYDVCLVRGGTPEVKAGWNWHHRYLIGLPMVDVQSVGAGGGSIARVEAGALKVGPAERRRRAGPGVLRPRRHRSRRSPTPTCARLSEPEAFLRRAR
jgi:N-methylhydantoinase A